MCQEISYAISAFKNVLSAIAPNVVYQHVVSVVGLEVCLTSPVRTQNTSSYVICVHVRSVTPDEGLNLISFKPCCVLWSIEQALCYIPGVDKIFVKRATCGNVEKAKSRH